MSNTEKESKDMTAEEREAWTEGVIRNYAYGSAAVGLVPIPLIDLVALTGLQLKLIHRLSTFYGVPFSEERTKKIIASLAGASIPIGLTRAACSVLKIFPVVGLAASIVAMPALSGASTYAVGKIFAQHFESGGTFINFDIIKAKGYYEEQVKKGREVVAELKKTSSET
ncbi:MAG: YcjF family protein [Nitrospirae bacterium]|nr:YcjF family protein [Nitrospirota bacterium]